MRAQMSVQRSLIDEGFHAHIALELSLIRMREHVNFQGTFPTVHLPANRAHFLIFSCNQKSHQNKSRQKIFLKLTGMRQHVFGQIGFDQKLH